MKTFRYSKHFEFDNNTLEEVQAYDVCKRGSSANVYLVGDVAYVATIDKSKDLLQNVNSAFVPKVHKVGWTRIKRCGKWQDAGVYVMKRFRKADARNRKIAKIANDIFDSRPAHVIKHVLLNPNSVMDYEWMADQCYTHDLEEIQSLGELIHASLNYKGSRLDFHSQNFMQDDEGNIQWVDMIYIP